MTAPALVALADTGQAPRSARTVRDIATMTRRVRPDLRIEPAYLDETGPDVDTVVTALVRGKGRRRSSPCPCRCRRRIFASAMRSRSWRRWLTVTATSRSGPRRLWDPTPRVLTSLDDRLREALRSARIRELDALVLAAAGSSDTRATATVARLARIWGARHRLPTSVAFASTVAPTTGEAVRGWRRQGRRNVAVGSLFVTAGTLADRATELAREAGAVAVSLPLGAHDAVARVILARYAVGALQLVDIPA